MAWYDRIFRKKQNVEWTDQQQKNLKDLYEILTEMDRLEAEAIRFIKAQTELQRQHQQDREN